MTVVPGSWSKRLARGREGRLVLRGGLGCGTVRS
jgi:hypothetical protein